MCGEVGKHLIEGISRRVRPRDHRAPSRPESTTSSPSTAMPSIADMCRLVREHGLFVGPSSGANLVAARARRDAHPAAREVVTFFCDEGEKYITDYFTPG